MEAVQAPLCCGSARSVDKIGDAVAIEPHVKVSLYRAAEN